MNEPTLLTGRVLDAANEVYGRIHFQASKPGSDRTFGIFDGERPVALGRVQRHPGDALELGGFWVDEALRGTGLARKLVAHVLDALEPGTVAWCLAFEHLENFYRSFDMHPFDRAAAPPAIRDKLAFCDEQHARGLYHPIRLLRYERPRPA